jgi:hypothetical protein
MSHSPSYSLILCTSEKVVYKCYVMQSGPLISMTVLIDNCDLDLNARS